MIQETDDVFVQGTDICGTSGKENPNVLFNLSPGLAMPSLHLSLTAVANKINFFPLQELSRVALVKYVSHIRATIKYRQTET